MDIATLLLEYLKELNAKSQKSQRKYLLNKGKEQLSWVYINFVALYKLYFAFLKTYFFFAFS